MLYQLYQSFDDALYPARIAADLFARQMASSQMALSQWWPGWPPLPGANRFTAACEIFAGTRLTHHRPPFGIDTVTVGGRAVAVREETADATPFCTLLHFAKDVAVRQPRVLVVAPMSGHFATLLRSTVRTMLPDHDVYITDWHNAREVPLSAGDFDFDDYIDHVIRCLEHLGPPCHVVAVCQPTVAVLAAVALMAADGNEAQPRTMTLMAGPIDTSIQPTRVDDLATEHPIEWFEANLISQVPYGHPGAFRRVYPGFLQIAAFMTMNLDRHLDAFADHYDHLATEHAGPPNGEAPNGQMSAIRAHRAFYEEYFAVMDLPAAFYLQTVERIFQKQQLARGTLVSRGRPVDPSAIRRTTVMTVEGENDDICAIGQTLAAQELCTRLNPAKKRHHLQTGVGHYGVFSGRRWATEIYPRVREVIWSNT